MKKAVLAVISILVLISIPQMHIQLFSTQSQETLGTSHNLSKVEAKAPIHNIATTNLTPSITRIVDDYIWATNAISAEGLDNLDLPGHTTVPVSGAAYDGYGEPHWTGNFSVSYPIDSVNQINVTYLPFTPGNYTVTLTEGVDYIVHRFAKIQLLTPLDVPIINEYWKDGVNTSLFEWARINYVASGIESVYVDMNNGTARFGRNWGYAEPLPSEWWYDPCWPREFMLWQLLDFYYERPYDWPLGSEWWINYTAASYLTVDYNAIGPPVINATLDIYPNVLNLQSKGKFIFGYIELPEGYEVGDIAVSTIMLNNTVSIDLAATVKVGDYDNDSLNDLMITFNRTKIVEYIISEGVTDSKVALTLTGELRKSASFKGDVTIMVSSLVGDVNCDGTVDLYDIIMIAVIYGCREGELGWTPNADLSPQYGVIDIYDIITCVCHYGETYP